MITTPIPLSHCLFCCRCCGASFSGAVYEPFFGPFPGGVRAQVPVPAVYLALLQALPGVVSQPLPNISLSL